MQGLKYIAKRYFLTKNKSTAINFMSFLAIAGIVVSTCAMIIVLSGLSGLKKHTLEFIPKVSADLKVSPLKGSSFKLTPEMIHFLENNGLNFTKVIENKALLSINQNNQIVRIKGVEKNFPREKVDSIMLQGDWLESESNQIVVGVGIAYSLGVSTLDVLNPVRLYVPKPGRGQITSENDLLRSSLAVSSGVFSVNQELDNQLVFAGLEFAQNLYGLNNSEISYIEIFDNTLSSHTIEEISSFFGAEFIVSDMFEQHGLIYKMLQTEQLTTFLIFLLIVIIAMFNLFSALIMMVLEKRKNLRTLMILGMKNSDVGNVFFYQGVMVSLTGCFIGLALGSLLLFLQKEFSLFMLSQSLAYPVEYSFENYIVVFFTVLLLGAGVSSVVAYYTKKSVQQTSQQ